MSSSRLLICSHEPNALFASLDAIVADVVARIMLCRPVVDVLAAAEEAAALEVLGKSGKLRHQTNLP